MPDNPFKNSSYQDPTQGEKINNMRTRKVARIHRPDGSVEEVLLSNRESVPDENGNYADIETIGVVFDRVGNQIPPEYIHNYKLSHTGIAICPNDKSALCNYWMHSANAPRLIAVGHDGIETPDGAICSCCQDRQAIMWLVFSIIAVFVAIGIFKGTGLF